MSTYINIATGSIVEPEEVMEWEQMCRDMPPHNYSRKCDCYECQGEKYKLVK